MRRGDGQGDPRRVGQRKWVRGSHTSMSTTQKRRGGVLSWLIVGWYGFCQALYKGIEGEDWGELFSAYKEMSRAVGVKKPQEARKAKGLWKIKAAKDAGEEYHDSTRKDNIQGQDWHFWEVHLKDPIVALDKVLNCVESSYSRSRPGCLVEGCLAMAGVGFLQSLREKQIWEGAWPYLDPMGSVCVCAQRPWSGMCHRRVGRMASSFT